MVQLNKYGAKPFVYSVGGVRLRVSGSATSMEYMICARMIRRINKYICWNDNWKRKTKIFEKKSVPVPLCGKKSHRTTLGANPSSAVIRELRHKTVTSLLLV